MKLFKNLFQKRNLKQEYIDKAQIEFDIVLGTLHREMHKDNDYNYSSDFNIADFLSQKVEKYIDKNLPRYFNLQYWYNKKLDDLLEEILDKKLKENFEKYFNSTTEEYIKKALTEIKLYDIRATKTFENFMKDYFEKNKIELAFKIYNILENEKFIDTLSEKIWEDIGDMLQNKLKDNCKY